MATRPQIAMIHTLKSKLGMSDDDYRAMLGGFGVSSSKDLGTSAAREVIETLIKQSGGGSYAPPTAQGRRADGKYYVPSVTRRLAEPVNSVPRAATEAQVAKIKKMWDEVSRIEDSSDRARALDSFIEKRFRVSHVKWLPRSDVGKVIHTLTAMIKSKQKGVENA